MDDEGEMKTEDRVDRPGQDRVDRAPQQTQDQAATPAELTFNKYADDKVADNRHTETSGRSSGQSLAQEEVGNWWDVQPEGAGGVYLLIA